MLGAAQIIPFHRPPKKEWKNGVEKKRRLYIDLSQEEDGLEEEAPMYYEDMSESSEESEASFDMQEYIAGLLPGELVDGKKGKEWRVSFRNPAAADKSKETLYMFFTPPGNFIAANFSGQ